MDVKKENDPFKYGDQLMRSINYIRESVIPSFFSDNRHEINRLYDLSKTDYTYKTMKRFSVNPVAFMESYLDYEDRLVEFTEATYTMESGDVAIESVHDRLITIEESTKQMHDKCQAEAYSERKFTDIMSDVFTLLEYCEGKSDVYNRYENIIKSVKNTSFSGTGEYLDAQKDYAMHVLESTAGIIEDSLILSFDAFKTAQEISSVNKRDYKNDKKRPQYQLF